MHLITRLLWRIPKVDISRACCSKSIRKLTTMAKTAINVAAAVLVHGKKVLLARRRGGYLDSLWEFPGGKLEKDESAGHAAHRELIEELDIRIVPEQTLLVLEHEYPDKTVRLHFVKCRLSDSPDQCLAKMTKNPEVSWFAPTDFPLGEFCPADRIAVGHLPWKQIITCEDGNE
ncbi:MAG: 8-oxo-dGTP diphosphatase MutT [Candidatus Riflebacteria bacterium HGW-Riflebacteria-1]|nr:MAG: 8-oxo-dGTP diphosphatase MutT [Candidatus Riflebacteria bacterium HGW-Riflebacteria-1]PKL41770.1 MAG: 8-oxo-dGTP diphosphatase MutT [Candidatus Riflebacteria bacterium HGW-Riflebacteria-2]